MPILSWGDFELRLSVPEGDFVKMASIHFTYYSLGMLMPTLMVLGIGFFCLWILRIDPGYFISKMVVLLPGLIGLAFTLLLIGTPYVFLGMPLQLITWVILSWRLLRIRNGFTGAGLTLLVCLVMTAVNLVVYADMASNLSRFFEVVFIVWVLIGLPPAFIRLAAQRKISLVRLSGGAILGIFLSVLVFLITFGDYQSFWVFLVLLIPGSIISVPFILLVRFSPWVRGMITGELLQSSQVEDLPLEATGSLTD